MNDNMLVPTLGDAKDPVNASTINRMMRTIEMTMRKMISMGKVKVTTATLDPLTVAALPVRVLPGTIAYASNGRKNGEGAGAGTGVLVFHDGTAWRACDTGQTVSD